MGPDGPGVDADLPDGAHWYPVAAPDMGYLESVDCDALLEFARTHDAAVRVECAMGGFASPDRPIASIGAAHPPDPEARERLACLFAIDSYRTIEQDIAFGLRQLVDVALKGLSPAINDTTTAVTAIDYISVILQCLAGRSIAPRPIPDGDVLRVLPAGPDFERLVALGFDQIVENAEGNATVLLRLLQAIEQVRSGTTSAERHAVLDAKRAVIAEVARRTAPNAAALRLVEAQLADGRANEDTSGA